MATAHRPIASMLATVALVLAYRTGAFADPPSHARPAAVVARRAQGPIVVDGVLDSAEWAGAIETAPLVQRRPDLGAPAAHRTTARVLYDDHAIYIGVSCGSSGRVDAQLAQRDSLPRGDTLRVLLDTRGDGVTAFDFEVSPGAVQADALVNGDNGSNYAWDAVWQAETQVTPTGWTAEIAIPWRVVRFTNGAERNTIQIERYDIATGETVAIVPVPDQAPRYVARFAPLEGITGLTTLLPREFRPYVSGRWRLSRDPSLLDSTATLTGSAGADFKLGLTTDLILDATVHPDFGQVEVDPAIVNLTTFEPFFAERRPFFLEGTDIFTTPLMLLHTRRIGAAPDIPDPAHPNGVITAVDPVTTLWGAAKATGRVGGVSLGVLDALTAPVYAQEQYPSALTGRTVTDERHVGEWTNWFALRARESVGAGSTVGVLATQVARLGALGGLGGGDVHTYAHPDDRALGFDWDLRAPDDTHRIVGQVAATHAWNATQGEHTGYGAYVSVQRAEDRTLLWGIRARAYSADFDPNGMGYLDRPDLVRISGDVTIKTRRPRGFLRSAFVRPIAYYAVNTHGLPVDRGAMVQASITGTNLWDVVAYFGVDAPTYDDRETRGGIPFAISTSPFGGFTINTDRRARVSARLSGNLTTVNGGYRTETSLALTLNPVSSLALSLTGEVQGRVGSPRWIETDTVGTVNTYVFGDQTARILDVTFRVAWALTRRLTLTLFSQLLLAELRYANYTQLTTPFTLVPYAYAGAPGYDRQDLTINAVARWEFLPGSILSLVFLHRQALTTDQGTVGYGVGISRLADATPDDQAQLRLTWLVM